MHNAYCANYTCTGSIPSNATLLSGSDQNLTSNVENKLYESEAEAKGKKCAYVCNESAGYSYLNGQCVHDEPYPNDDEYAYTWACHSYCTDKDTTIDICKDRPTRGDCERDGSACRWNDSPYGGGWCEKNEEGSYNCEYDNKTSCNNHNFCERKSEPLCVDITDVGFVENNHSSSIFDDNIIKDESFCAGKTHTCGNSSNNNSDPEILPIPEQLGFCIEDKGYYCNKIRNSCMTTEHGQEYINCNSQACKYCYQSQCGATDNLFNIQCRYMVGANFTQNECENYMGCRWSLLGI